MSSSNKNKYRAWRLVQRIDGVGLSRAQGKLKGLISSVSTKRAYHSCLCSYLDWRDENGLARANQDQLPELEAYLYELAETHQQKTVDQHKSALSIVFKKQGKLPAVSSEVPTSVSPRNYYLSEVLLLIQHLDRKNAVAILLCFFVGLRAHEILTLRRADEAKKSKSRKWSENRFYGISNFTIYLVTGKGGLTREIAVPNELVQIIESCRLIHPRETSDRGIKYQLLYDLGYGKNLSACFSRASDKHLHWSTGLHGLRHSYAQNRVFRLINLKIEYSVALKMVSEELGHFRPAITLCYLR